MATKHYPRNIKEELDSVKQIDRAKLSKKLDGSEQNFKYNKGKEHVEIKYKKGWKGSRAFRNKDFNDYQRIQYIKQKKRRQSEHDKMLNELDPERNEVKVKPKKVKNNEKVMLSRGHHSGGRARNF